MRTALFSLALTALSFSLAGCAAVPESDSADGEDGALESEEVKAKPFVHPGVLVDRAQLDFVKAKIKAGAEPWKSAFAQAAGSKLGSLSYKPGAIAHVICGSYSNPDIGCSAEKDDSAAAYTHALLWYFTGDTAHAKKAIQIMNAWSSTLKDHQNSNAPLQSAWVGAVFPRAAEIIRYTYDGWSAGDVARFEKMLEKVYLPEVVHGAPNTNGNWELSMTEATMAISVFLDDRPTFDKALSMWRKRVPAYIYLTSDGALPVPPPGGSKNSKSELTDYWYGQSKLTDGLSQETCRDLGHVNLGFASMINAAETARLQGVDLYSEQAKRITAGYEFHAHLIGGGSVPGWLCGGKLDSATASETWEIGYNEYAVRLGKSLPNTKKLVEKNRPTGVNHIMVWETLTHAKTGKVGVP